MIILLTFCQVLLRYDQVFELTEKNANGPHEFFIAVEVLSRSSLHILSAQVCSTTFTTSISHSPGNWYKPVEDNEN